MFTYLQSSAYSLENVIFSKEIQISYKRIRSLISKVLSIALIRKLALSKSNKTPFRLLHNFIIKKQTIDSQIVD